MQPLRILQLSDFHLKPAADQLLRGIPTHRCVAEVLAFARARYPDASLVVLSGDLIDGGEPHAAYRIVRDMLGDWLPRCRLIPGNSDDPAAMRAVFPERLPGDGVSLTFSESLAGWKVIGLDTHRPRFAVGRLGMPQLDWLKARLAAHPDQPTILFMHHPPIAVGTPCFDRKGLGNLQHLASIIAEACQVRALFFGHVHQECEGEFEGRPAFGLPSVTLQFARGTTELGFADLPPGFRSIELGDEGFRTEVVRLPELKYAPSTPHWWTRFTAKQYRKMHFMYARIKKWVTGEETW